MRRSEFKADGLGYSLTFPDVATTFTVDRIKPTSDGMRGHVIVKSGFPGARTYADGVVHYTIENLSSGAARRAMGKMLEIKIPTDPPLDWFGMYDEFCTAVMRADREGKRSDEVGLLVPSDRTHGLLLDPILPFGVHSILFGPGGLGKSITAVALAVSLETGLEIIPGFKPLQRGPTLYLNWETTREDIDARIKAVCAGAGIKPVRLFHLAGGGRPLAQRVESIARDIDRTAAIMVVVDSNGKAIGTSGEGPIEDAANRFASALDELDRTALCIDHISKAGSEMQGGARNPYGSVMKSNWARATWEMTQSRPPLDGETHLVLHHRKHNTTAEHEPIGLVMRWDRGAVVWETEDVDTADISYGATIRDQIAAALLDHPLRISEIASKTGRTEAVVKTNLYRARDMFRRLDTGDWMLVG